jgi:hypothetical protein
MQIQIQEKAHLSLEKERKALTSETTSSLAVAKAEWLREKDEQVKSEVESALRVIESEWMAKQGEELRQAVEKAVKECNTRWRHRVTEAELEIKATKEEMEKKVIEVQEEACHRHKLETAQLKSELERLHKKELEQSKQEGEKSTCRAVAAVKEDLKRQYESRTRRLQEEVAAANADRRTWEEERKQILEKQKELDTASQVSTSLNSPTQRCELQRDQAQPQRNREIKTISTQVK